MSVNGADLTDVGIFSLPMHPVAAVFPSMTETEIDQLADDIRVNGLRCPVIMDHAGEHLVDGRNRREACRRAGVEIKTDRLSADQDATKFIISLNLQRRHLDESQRALIAARLATMRQGERTDLGPSANLPEVAGGLPLISQTAAAEMLNVSIRTVTSARKVVKEGAPELVDAVEAGQLKVSEAARIAKLPKPLQSKVTALSKARRSAVVSSPTQTPADRKSANVLVAVSSMLEDQPLQTLAALVRVFSDLHSRLDVLSKERRVTIARGFLSALGIIPDDLSTGHLGRAPPEVPPTPAAAFPKEEPPSKITRDDGGLTEIWEGLKLNSQKWAAKWIADGCPTSAYPNEHFTITEKLLPFRAVANQTGPLQRQRFLENARELCPELAVSV